MYFRVRTFADSYGDELSVLVGDNNQPVFWPNVFATMEFRSKSPKTLSAALRALGMFESWRQSKGLADSNDLANGSVLGVQDAEDLAMFLRLTRPAQDEETLCDKPASHQKVIRLESVRKFNLGTNTDKRYAGATEAANRCRWVAKYLEFLRDRSISGIRDRDKQKALEVTANVAINRLRTLTPRVSSGIGDESLVGIDGSDIRLITAALDPASTSGISIFPSKFLRARNHLIWLFFAVTGMRRAELAKLKVDDVDYSSRRVSIRESKTLPRTVPISSEAALAFHGFIVDHWSKLPARSTQHGRIFTTKDGTPLKNATINQLFSNIRTRVPDAPQNLTPHALRRSWNERFSARIDALPAQQRPSQNEELQIRNRLMGWSDRSQMGARYAKRHIQKKADAIAEDLANTLITDKGKESE